jgi:hypothetical protein
MEQQSTAARTSTGPHRWPPGTCGNPLGSKLLNARADALFGEIRGDFADDLSAVDTVLLRQACRLLARGERLRDPDAAVRLSSEARRILAALKRKRAEQTGPSLAEYLASRRGGGGDAE